LTKTFEELLKPVFPELVRYARALAGSRSDGDDVLQDALLNGWRKFGSLRDQDGFKFWMLRIIRNANLSRVRSHRFKSFLGLEAAQRLPAPDALPFEDKEWVRLALSKVPRDQREALILFEILGMSVKEVARQQNTSEGAVKSRLSRGRKRLCNELDALTTEEQGHGEALAEGC
jgi:RNA polymerase sigma-70 factor, ECF subfamily